MLILRVWESFFADRCGGMPTGQRLDPSPGEGGLLSPLPRTRHPRRDMQSQARWGRGLATSPRPPRLPLSHRSTEELPRREDAGGCRRGRAQPRRERECPRTTNTLSPVTSLHRRGEGNPASKGGEAGGAPVSGVAAPQCLSSSNGRVKVFALGLIIKDTWVLLSHALFFFFFLINCKPHPGC